MFLLAWLRAPFQTHGNNNALSYKMKVCFHSLFSIVNGNSIKILFQAHLHQKLWYACILIPHTI
jgi:hypothetical protein